MSKIHHDIEFSVLRKKLDRAGSMDEKISMLEQLVALNPRHPKNLALRKKYRDEMENLKTKRSNKRKASVSVYDTIHYKRLVVIVGETNSGKSTLLNRLSDSEIEVSEHPFTTWHPEIQMLSCRDVPVMVVEIPALFEGDNDESKYRLIKNSDVIGICAREAEEATRVVGYLEQNLIIPENSKVNHDFKTMVRSTERKEVPSFVITRDSFPPEFYLQVSANDDAESVLGTMYTLLNIQRIYSLNQGEVKDKPVVFSAERLVTVQDYILELDKRLVSRMKRARVIHADTSVPDVQSAGAEYILHDGDTVELLLK